MCLKGFLIIVSDIEQEEGLCTLSLKVGIKGGNLLFIVSQWESILDDHHVILGDFLWEFT